MTKHQKRRVLYEAAEMIASGDHEFSCYAITEDDLGELYDLRVAYAEFYSQNSLDSWEGLYNSWPDFKREWRQTMLLFFAEAGV